MTGVPPELWKSQGTLAFRAAFTTAAWSVGDRAIQNHLFNDLPRNVYRKRLAVFIRKLRAEGKLEAFVSAYAIYLVTR